MVSTSRLRWLISRTRRKIWYRAALISAASVVLAALTGPIARAIPYHFTGDIGQDAVGTVLQIIASSMLAVTTFSLTAMVSAYSSATQLATPRATQLMISDRTSQNALSTFLGAFVFSVVGIIGLQTRLYGGQGRVVLLIATVAVVALVVVTLLRWIAHLASFGRMADVIDRVEDAACAAMTAHARAPFGGGRPAVPVPATARPLRAPEIGYVTHVDITALGRLATRHDLVIYLDALPGTLVHDERPLIHVVGAVDTELENAVAGAFTIERHRSFDHDPRLGVIALSEIAGRALSPAVNDPGTAVEVLGALLRTLTRLSDAPARECNDPPPVHVPRPSLEEFLRDGFGPIIRDGAGQEEVVVRTCKVLATLRGALPEARTSLIALTGELRQNVAVTMPDGRVRDRTLAICDAVFGADQTPPADR